MLDKQIEEAAGILGPGGFESVRDQRPEELINLPYYDRQIARNGNQNYYRLLYALARDFKPKIYVELGVECGWGLQHVRIANPNTYIIGIDLNYDMFSDCLDRDDFRLITGDAAGCADNVKDLLCDKLIDMIFFDADHSRLLEEFKAWDSLCCRGCIQLFDDVLAPHTLAAWNAIPEPKQIAPQLHLGEGNGFGIRIKP